jgi:hypothetical protein
MSRRRNIVHAACDLAALLHEPGPVGDRWQVLSSCPNRSLLERVGHRRTVDLAFVTAAGPVVSLRIDKDELSLRKRQRARFRHQAADMVQVTVRRGVIPARRRFASSPGKLPKDGPSFSVMVVALHERDPLERGGTGCRIDDAHLDLRCSARVADWARASVSLSSAPQLRASNRHRRGWCRR